VLVIRRDLVDEIVAHARAEHPHEACGLIAGAEGAERPERVIRMVNAAKPSGDEAGEARERAHRDVLLGEHGEYCGEARSSTTYYTFDPAEYLRVQRELDGRDEWAVVNYHSHTRSAAYPSVVDTELASGPASDPRIHYVIVSTRSEDEEVRSYRIVDGEVTEEDITVVESYVVESYMFAHTGADDVPDNS
jgi:[CysO sulfur-carrier protein]-S-L-cysteine hydrolase